MAARLAEVDPPTAVWEADPLAQAWSAIAPISGGPLTSSSRSPPASWREPLKRCGSRDAPATSEWKPVPGGRERPQNPSRTPGPGASLGAQAAQAPGRRATPTGLSTGVAGWAAPGPRLAAPLPL